MLKCVAKQFFLTDSLQSEALSFNGVGIGETMAPGIVDRPAGTGDYLVMMFHDTVDLGTTVSTVYPANTMVVWEPGAHQHYGNEQDVWQHSWMHCAGPRMDAIVAATQVPINRPFPIGRPQAIEHYLWDAYLEMTEHVSPLADIVGNAIHNCMIDVKRQIDGEQLAMPDTFAALKRYLGENLQEHLSLSDMASRLNMSRSHFSSEFRRYVGLSPIEYVIRLRLQAALNLLSDRHRTIAQVAQEVGYDDPSLFSRQFQERFNMSPSEMSKRHRSGLSSI